MLVLTRRVGETLVIELPNGETICLTVTGVKGNQVRHPDKFIIIC